MKNFSSSLLKDFQFIIKDFLEFLFCRDNFLLKKKIKKFLFFRNGKNFLLKNLFRKFYLRNLEGFTFKSEESKNTLFILWNTFFFGSWGPKVVNKNVPNSWLNKIIGKISKGAKYYCHKWIKDENLYWNLEAKILENLSFYLGSSQKKSSKINWEDWKGESCSRKNKETFKRSLSLFIVGYSSQSLSS